MSDSENIKDIVGERYRHGFVTDIEADVAPAGLNEDVIRMISNKKKRAGFSTRLAA